LAHILLVVSPRSTGDHALEQSVARALRGIQPHGLAPPVVTGSLDAAAWGVLAPPFDALAGAGIPPLGTLDCTESALRLELPAIVVELTADFLRVEGDAVGARTLWYAESEAGFSVSTSQRALVRWLGNFEPADRAVGWFMLTGSLGPGTSWDGRIRPLPPAAALRFHRVSRTLEVLRGARPRFFTPSPVTAELEGELLGVLGDATARVPRGPGVALSLSGGLDSSLLLHGLGRERALDCVSWGAVHALDDPSSDAAIARQNAQHYGAPFRFLPIRPAPVDQAVDRFVAAAEGRVDHVSGYLDGLELWKRLAEDRVQLVVRGDEAFGWVPVLTAADVRRSVGAPELDDYGNREWLREIGLGDLAIPALPDSLRRGAESLPTWRDRLYQEFRIPVVLAALTTVKSGYVETHNPLLDPSILRLVARLPDRERTDKRFVRRVARTLLANLDSPRVRSDGAPSISRREVAELVLRELEGRELVEHLPTRLRAELRASATARASGTSGSETRPARGSRWDLRVPTWVRRLARNTVAQEGLGTDKLLLRALLLGRTLRLLRADANAETRP
jgi:asparagine synthetase B (glutamine-hydrolysing)